VSSEPRIGDIGLTAISGGVGRGIRFGQWLNGNGWSDYQHAFVYVGQADVDPGQGMIIEAMPGGAILSRLEIYRPDRVRWLRCPPGYGDAVAAAALSLRGTPYSFLDYGAIALHRLHIPVPHLKAYISTSKHEICSQLCDDAAMRGGWHLFRDDRWPGFVTPGALYQLYLLQVEADDSV
jgi:hypothetical protein